ncbi:MAG: hypothetical protein JRJ03_15115 [Deltaproteobacteria bacterium]|nr:hypothetical protein [Deltaproteobacteria bacterium]MBW2066242.1 hypothetical protein [Deltaproteobacteria bacterium]
MNELEKRFGTLAVERGFVSKEQLLEALKTQVEQDLDGKRHKPIGSILYQMGYISMPQIREVLDIMQKSKNKG